MNTVKILGLFAFLLALSACHKQEDMGPVNKNDKKPAPVSNVEVESLPGGARINYTLPASENILYIKAVYEIRDGVEQEVKSSYYNRSLIIEGFPDTEEYEVKLYTVSRGEVESDPLTVKVNPLSPPVREVFKTLNVEPTFAGVKVDFQNDAGANVVLTVLAADSMGDLITADRVYTKAITGQFATRGFPAEERKFGVFVRDRWDNMSDTLFVTLTPWPEQEIDKTKITFINLPGDNTVQHCCGDGVSDVFDGEWNSGSAFHTKPANGLPVAFTFDLGQTYSLSRMIFHHRRGGGAGASDGAYKAGDVKVFELYGRADAPDPDGSWEGWTKIGTFESRQISNDVNENFQFAVVDGEGFDMPLGTPPVRYLRYRAIETWGGLTYIYIAELTFFGNPE